MIALVSGLSAGVMHGQSAVPADSVTIRIVGVELRSAVQLVQQYLDRPVIFVGAPNGTQVTLETPHPVARRDVLRLVRGMLDAQGYELTDDTLSGAYRVRPKEARFASSQPSLQPPAPDQQMRHPTGSPELFVIALHHARADNVAATINTLFARSNSAAISPPGNASRSTTLADELRSTRLAPIDSVLPDQAGARAGRPASLTGELTIVADTRANNLLVRANRADFDLIRAAVEQIDVRPPQVLIEVLIVEARTDRNFSLGIEASLNDHHLDHTDNTTVGGSYSPGSSSLGDLTLRVMGIGSWDVDATIRAAASRGDARIVSRPVVLTANDQEAEMVVGTQRPFVQVSRSLPTDDAVRDQVVQYRDVGTKLTVRPTISIDGTVALAVTQEVSSATNETAFNAPIIATRSVKTDLLAHDAQTIVLGGLTDRQREVQTSGIPILSRIPFVGGLFGGQTRTSNETELFIFLTPYVIRTDDDVKRLTDPLRERAKSIQP
jgi:type II secretory pathway component GspD/PulD (secretin)